MTYASNDSGYPFGHPESFVGDSPSPKLAASVGQLNTPKAWLCTCHKFAVPLTCDIDRSGISRPLIKSQTFGILPTLKDIAQDMSEYHAEYNENRRADEIKAEEEKKHSFRHDFFVAAFTIALTLFFEHIHDIIEFI